MERESLNPTRFRTLRSRVRWGAPPSVEVCEPTLRTSADGRAQGKLRRELRPRDRMAGTVVDLMRLRHRLGEPFAYTALRRFGDRPAAQPPLLMDYAERLGVFGPVRAALDVVSAGRTTRLARPLLAVPYLDLQNRARRDSRGTQELLTMYVVERWLARLSRSAYADDFVLKGGMLLAAFGVNRVPPLTDPITPAPRRVELPALRPNGTPIHLLGYPVETVLAEKLATAIQPGPANTRVRDWADL